MFTKSSSAKLSRIVCSLIQFNSNLVKKIYHSRRADNLFSKFVKFCFYWNQKIWNLLCNNEYTSPAAPDQTSGVFWAIVGNTYSIYLHFVDQLGVPPWICIGVFFEKKPFHKVIFIQLYSGFPMYKDAGWLSFYSFNRSIDRWNKN